MNKRRDRIAGELETVCWPVTRLAEALGAIASHCGMSTRVTATTPASAPVDEDDLADFAEAMAAHAGLETVQVFSTLDELESLLRQGAPLIVRLASLAGGPFLAIGECRRRSVLAIGPEGQHRWLSIGSLSDVIRAPFARPLAPAIERAIEQLSLRGHQQRKARAVLMRDRLSTARFRGCWLLRLPSGSTLREEASEARFGQRIAALVTAYLAQYALFVGSWWLLGHAVLNGAVDRGWLLGWLLLLFSLIPLRLAVTWQQGLVTLSIGAWIRRRLLRGAFQIDRQEVKRKGVGQLFSVVVEASALDAMALTGGLSAAFALLEVVGAMGVLWWGASRWPVAALAACVATAMASAWVYYTRRRTWTAQRLEMSHDLLETMMGHRTRLAQQPPSQQHLREDLALDKALTLGRRMDSTGLWLTAAIPRGWLVVALTALLPALASGMSTTKAAISLGGVILAFRALQRLAGGIVSLTGAIVAGQSVAALARAAASRPLPLLALAAARSRVPGEGPKEPVLQARDLVFRYRTQREAVIAGATLNVEPGARFLLEGASGTGKTTFATLLAGLEPAESGLLLAGGLDRAALGPRGWGRRVVMAPQIHDNHLLGGTLAFNLLMGRRWPAESADLREAEAMCRELGLGELLDRLPGGLDQVVGETGWQLSQGERVRVFLARALLQKPDVLILDESFSALDPENLDRAVRTVTSQSAAVLAIAHL